MYISIYIYIRIYSTTRYVCMQFASTGLLHTHIVCTHRHASCIHTHTHTSTQIYILLHDYFHHSVASTIAHSNKNKTFFISLSLSLIFFVFIFFLSFCSFFSMSWMQAKTFSFPFRSVANCPLLFEEYGSR